MPTIANRIRQLVGDQSVSSFAADLGVAEGTVRAWINGTAEPKASALMKLAAKTGKSIDWIVLGVNSQKTDATAQKTEESDIVHVPTLTFEASAGYGRLIGDEYEHTTPMPRAFLEASDIRPANARLIQISGSSMEKTLNDGEFALFDASKTAIADGKVFVFLVDDSVYVKRLRSTRDALVIISDNPDYPDDKIVPDDGFRVLGRVKSAWKPV